jgi:hypothetical protein
MAISFRKIFCGVKAGEIKPSLKEVRPHLSNTTSMIPYSSLSTSKTSTSFAFPPDDQPTLHACNTYVLNVMIMSFDVVTVTCMS